MMQETQMLAWVAGISMAGLLIASAGMWVVRPPTRAVEGSVAPAFSLPDQDGVLRRLDDYRGRWLVLYFYPRDATPHCTREACGFRDASAALNGLGAAVVGISTDSVVTHARFARGHHLSFPLLSDPSGAVARAYGSLLNLGFLRVARRHTFLIAPDGRIAARFDDVDVTRHAADVAQALARLQAPDVPATVTPRA